MWGRLGPACPCEARAQGRVVGRKDWRGVAAGFLRGLAWAGSWPRACPAGPAPCRSRTAWAPHTAWAALWLWCRKERARAVTTVFGGLDLGSAVGLLLCGPLIHWLGWQSVFYIFAALGLVWCVAWPLCRPEQPDSDLPPYMLLRARQQAVGGAAAAAKPAADVPWGEFLRSAPVWAVIVAHFCYNWGYYTLLAWLPSYMDMALGEARPLQPVGLSAAVCRIHRAQHLHAWPAACAQGWTWARARC